MLLLPLKWQPLISMTKLKAKDRVVSGKIIRKQ